MNQKKIDEAVEFAQDFLELVEYEQAHAEIGPHKMLVYQALLALQARCERYEVVLKYVEDYSNDGHIAYSARQALAAEESER